MGLPEKKPFISPEEYLLAERNAFEKSEYFNGEIFAMAGATKEHNRIVSSVIGEFTSHLKGKRCNTYPGDMRILVSENGLYTYPDLIVVCGKEEYLDNEFDTLLNPSIIVEVLSQSTKDYDMGSKFMLYRSLPSLKEYITISSLEFHVEKHIKNPDNSWTLFETHGIENSVYVDSIDLNLKMTDIYYNLEWNKNLKRISPVIF
ncbi:MAG: Uma2 family endonuclease [Opitutaceae bacterium]|nr:Uma2 family endonuclease [Cytophagales bacterium]